MEILISNLEELIEFQPPSKAGSNQIVYRKEKTDWAIDELERMTGINLKDIQPGEVINLNQELKQPHFISTSKYPNGGYAILGANQQPKVKYELQVEEGCKMLDVCEHLGADYFGENEKFADKIMMDAEILFQNGTIIKIRSIEKDKDGIFIIKGSLSPIVKL